MAATAINSCQRCGERHVLFFAIRNSVEVGRRYEFICPRGRDRVQFTATKDDGWKPTDSKPPGSVIVREVAARP